jgi:hypothetical protein
MSPVTFIVLSVLLLGTIGVSLYGAAVLPPTAQWPLHLGPAGYGNWVPRNIGLLMGPAIATVIFVMLVVTAHSQQTDGASGLSAGLTIALALMLANQLGALKAALTRSGRNQS